MKTEKSVGLDIGKDSVKLVELVHQDEAVKLSKIDLAQIPPTPAGSTEQSQVLRKIINHLFAKNQLKQKDAIVGIKGQSVFIKFLEVLPVKAEKLEKTIQYEAQQQIPFSLDEVEWDAHILGPEPTDTSAAYRVLLVAIKKDKLKAQMELMESLGLRSSVLDVGTLGVYNCIRFNRDYDENKLTCLIDMGAGSSDLIILEGENFWMRSFTIGGDNITVALEKKLDIGLAEAQGLKEQTNVRSPDVQEALSAVLEDLRGEITRSVEYYYFQKKQDAWQEAASTEEPQARPEVKAAGEIGEILLSGGVALMRGLDNFLAEKFSCPVRAIEPFKMVEVEEEAKPSLSLQNKLLFSQAVGLALRGLGKSHININLLKEQIKYKRLSRQRVFFAVGSAVLALLILVGASTFMRKDYRDKSLRLRHFKNLVNSFSAYQPQIKQLQEKRKLLEQGICTLSSLAMNRALWLKVLFEVQKMLPDGLWITDFTGTISAELASEAGVVSKVDLQGRAASYDDVNDFVLSLKSCTLFSEVKPLSSAFVEEQTTASEGAKEGKKEKVEVVKFSISMKVLPLK